MIDVETYKQNTESWLIDNADGLLSTGDVAEFYIAYQDTVATFTRILRLLRLDWDSFIVTNVQEIDPPDVFKYYRVYRVHVRVKQDTKWANARYYAYHLAEKTNAAAVVGVEDRIHQSGSWKNTSKTLVEYLKSLGDTDEIIADKMGNATKDVADTIGESIYNIVAPTAVLILIGIYLWKR